MIGYTVEFEDRNKKFVGLVIDKVRVPVQGESNCGASEDRYIVIVDQKIFRLKPLDILKAWN